MTLFSDAYRGKNVLVTGHTGFKGSWLCEWLIKLRAQVHGFSLDVPTDPAHYTAIDLGSRMAADLRGDVCDLSLVEAAIERSSPNFVFHLAAQPLVRRAYTHPLQTVEANVVGSVNVLEALRRARRPCVVVMVTTDKVYENREWEHAYRENDPLGGHDLYSASKAAAEILISSYRRSFFGDHTSGLPIAVATARGGNVIGGGDWAEDRIVPDCARSLSAGDPVRVRNRHSTRPWQHVLDLLSGYLTLGAQMDAASRARDSARLTSLCSAFNFGPPAQSSRSVGELVDVILKHWPGKVRDMTEPGARHEAGRLNLATERAGHLLGWQPRWDFEEAVRRTVHWYRAYYERGNGDHVADMRHLTSEQIEAYSLP